MISLKSAPQLLVCALLPVLLSSCGSSNDEVGAVTVNSIVLVPSTPVSIASGNIEQYVGIAEDSSGNQIPGVTFTWSSSDFAVATISSSGLAKALSVGTTHITASAQSASGATITSPISILNVTATAQVRGVAALGMPVAGAPVALKDSVGRQATATTAGDGSYAVDTTGLSPPFLLQLRLPDGRVLYSASADSNTDTSIDVNPLTDLAVRSWYRLESRSVDDSFVHPLSNPAPQPEAMQALASMLTDTMAPWLSQAGVDTAQFNPIKISFHADGTGFDRVLDEARVDVSAGQITLSDGSSARLSYDTAARSIAVMAVVKGIGLSQQSYSIP
jgi:hypothetical protein